jgi:hypothetical protein
MRADIFSCGGNEPSRCISPHWPLYGTYSIAYPMPPTGVYHILVHLSAHETEIVCPSPFYRLEATLGSQLSWYNRHGHSPTL